MKIQLLATIFIALLSSYASAVEVSELARCTKITEDGPRLACFDAISAKEVASQGEVVDAIVDSDMPAKQTGAWEVTIDIDPITDEKILSLALQSDMETSTFRRPVLFIRCKYKAPEIFIAWNEYLADETIVTVRISNGEPKISGWLQSTDQTATFSPNPTQLLNDIRPAEKLSARVTPYRSGPVTANFALSGLNEILIEHAEDCGMNR